MALDPKLQSKSCWQRCTALSSAPLPSHYLTVELRQHDSRLAMDKLLELLLKGTVKHMLHKLVLEKNI